MIMKRLYESPEIEIISVDAADVITASLGQDRDPFIDDLEWDIPL